MTRIVAQACAKLNLGLEVTGKRPDGYHEIVTILQAVDLADELVAEPATALTLACDDHSLSGPENLVVKAASALKELGGVAAGARMHLTKRIPPAAGLGGASADAAAALLALCQLWRLPVDDQALGAVAASLGSDVPFFLNGGLALAIGRGERIAPLPPLAGGVFVVAVPILAAPPAHKTATLYAALTHADLSTGDAVQAQASRLLAGRPLDPALLGNAFIGPWRRLHPAVSEIHDAMLRLGAPFVALSGAGPACYTYLADAPANQLAEALNREVLSKARIVTCRPVVKPIRVTST